MGLVHVDLFTTLDGVAQAPGGPDEDRERGFEFGGWQAPLIHEADGAAVDANLNDLDALLLGRKTYDIFAGYWPTQGLVDAPEIARRLNAVPKYVASRGLPTSRGTGRRSSVATWRPRFVRCGTATSTCG